MTGVSRCVILRKPGRIEIGSFPIPEIGDDDGLLEIEMAGICHTDYELYRGTHPAPFPIVLGHELVGRIAALGEKAAARWGVSVGDRVTVEAIVRCGFCSSCIQGHYKHCREIKVYGTYTSCDEPPHLWGSFSQFTYLAPGAIVHKVPEDMSPELATLSCVAVANGLSWGVTQGGIGIGDVVVVQGVGPIGLSGIAAAKEAGASIIIATGREIDLERLVLAKAFGADVIVNVDEEDLKAAVSRATGGELAHVVLDTTGSPKAIAISTTLVRPRGRVINAGLTGEGTVTPLALDSLLRPEVRLQHVFTYDYDAVKRALALIGTGKYPFEKLITHRFPMSSAEEAIKVAGREIAAPGVIKTVLVPD